MNNRQDNISDDINNCIDKAGIVRGQELEKVLNRVSQFLSFITKGVPNYVAMTILLTLETLPNSFFFLQRLIFLS